jgi:hypothetical protein
MAKKDEFQGQNGNFLPFSVLFQPENGSQMIVKCQKWSFIFLKKADKNAL